MRWSKPPNPRSHPRLCIGLRLPAFCTLLEGEHVPYDHGCISPSEALEVGELHKGLSAGAYSITKFEQRWRTCDGFSWPMTYCYHKCGIRHVEYREVQKTGASVSVSHTFSNGIIRECGSKVRSSTVDLSRYMLMFMPDIDVSPSYTSTT